MVFRTLTIVDLWFGAFYRTPIVAYKIPLRGGRGLFLWHILFPLKVVRESLNEVRGSSGALAVSFLSPPSTRERA